MVPLTFDVRWLMRECIRIAGHDDNWEYDEVSCAWWRRRATHETRDEHVVTREDQLRVLRRARDDFCEAHTKRVSESITREIMHKTPAEICELVQCQVRALGLLDTPPSSTATHVDICEYVENMSEDDRMFFLIEHRSDDAIQKYKDSGKFTRKCSQAMVTAMDALLASSVEARSAIQSVPIARGVFKWTSGTRERLVDKCCHALQAYLPCEFLLHRVSALDTEIHKASYVAQRPAPYFEGESLSNKNAELFLSVCNSFLKVITAVDWVHVIGTTTTEDARKIVWWTPSRGKYPKHSPESKQKLSLSNAAYTFNWDDSTKWCALQMVNFIHSCVSILTRTTLEKAFGKYLARAASSRTRAARTPKHSTPPPAASPSKNDEQMPAPTSVPVMSIARKERQGRKDVRNQRAIAAALKRALPPRMSQQYRAIQPNGGNVDATPVAVTIPPTTEPLTAEPPTITPRITQDVANAARRMSTQELYAAPPPPPTPHLSPRSAAPVDTLPAFYSHDSPPKRVHSAAQDTLQSPPTPLTQSQSVPSRLPSMSSRGSHSMNSTSSHPADKMSRAIRSRTPPSRQQQQQQQQHRPLQPPRRPAVVAQTTTADMLPVGTNAKRTLPTDGGEEQQTMMNLQKLENRVSTFHMSEREYNAIVIGNSITVDPQHGMRMDKETSDVLERFKEMTFATYNGRDNPKVIPHSIAVLGNTASVRRAQDFIRTKPLFVRRAKDDGEFQFNPFTATREELVKRFRDRQKEELDKMSASSWGDVACCE